MYDNKINDNQPIEIIEDEEREFDYSIQKEPIYKMTIELARGNYENLDIYIDSIPEELAYEFCKTKNLDFTAMNYLLEEIKKLMSKIPLTMPITTGTKIKREYSKEFIKNEEITNVSRIDPQIFKETEEKVKSSNIPNQASKLIERIREEAMHFEKLYKSVGEKGRSNNDRVCKKYKKGEIINYGERLYQRGIKLKEETNKKIFDMKNRLSAENSKQCTYKPMTNTFKENYNKSSVSKCDDYIINYNLYVKEKLDKLKKKYEEKVNYSFSPTIDDRSRRIANDKLGISDNFGSSHSQSALNKKYHEIMYERSKSKQGKLYQLENNIYGVYNFKPVLNNNENVGGNFYERQENFIKRKEENQKIIKDEMISPEETFVPKIKTQQRTINSNIFNYLYSYANKYNSNKVNRNEENMNNLKKISESKHVTYDSEYIYQKMKNETFIKIFKLLDSDGDGIISMYNMDIKKIPASVSKILQPIFKELKEEEETLNEEEFTRACEHLYDLITYDERKILINYNKKVDKKDYHNYTFKPEINNNSRRIDDNKKKFVMTKTLSAIDMKSNATGFDDKTNLSSLSKNKSFYS